MIPKKFSKAEYGKRAKEIVARMKQTATPFADNSDEAKKERIARGRRDRLWFFQAYMPHYFSKPFAEFHQEWNTLADIPDEPVFIAAPREHGKSAFWTLGIPVHDVCHKISPFDLIVSDTEGLAADFNQFVQIEIEENERIRQDFGDLTNPGNWESKDFTTRNGVRVLARGRGQRVRGLRNRQHRVGRILIDDLENDKTARNPRLVKETVDWILEALINTVAEGGSMTMINNLISKRGVLAQMIDMKREDDPAQPRFISRIYQSPIDDSEPLLWPEVWPLKRLLKKREMIGSVRYNKEFRNDPKDDDGMFQEGWIRYYHPDDIKGKALRVYTFIDPSSESNASNDFKAIITIGVDDSQRAGEVGIIYVLDAFLRRVSPDQMARVAYTRNEEFHPLLIGMEENALGEFAQSPFHLVAQEKRYILPIRGLKNSLAKETRIGRISPHIENGIIRFLKGHSDQDVLVEQLLYYPSSTMHDDGPDALEGAVDMAEKGSGVIEYRSSGVVRESCGRAVGRFVGG